MAAKRTTAVIAGVSSALVILTAVLGFLAAWNGRSFLIQGINVGLDGIVSVIDQGNTALDRFEGLVLKTWPSAMKKVEPLPGSGTVSAETVLHLLNGLVPRLSQLQRTAETFSRLAGPANDTLAWMNGPFLSQLPPLPVERWQSVAHRLASMADTTRAQIDTLTRQKRHGTASQKAVGIQKSIQTLKDFSRELTGWIAQTRSEQQTVLADIVAVRTRIDRWITNLAMGFLLVFAWVGTGQVYLLRHFWKTRSG